MRFRLGQVLSFGVLIASLGGGCGGQRGPEMGSVTGKVTLDGAPAAKLNIRFIPTDAEGSPAYGATNAQGQYILMYSQNKKGALLGKYHVEIEAVEPEMGDDGKPVGKQEIPKVPARYRKPGTLSAEVKRGHNSINFPLDSKPNIQD